MPHKPLDEKTVGLYNNNAVVQAAFVFLEKNTFTIDRLIEFSLKTEESFDNVKRLDIDPKEKDLETLCHRHLTVASLNESDVLVRRLRLKLTKDKDIDEAFLFQTEPQLPYPIENAVIDKIVVEKSEGTTLLVFLAAKKEYVQKVLNFWSKHSIDPEVISAEPVALNAILNAFSTSTPLQYAIHIGKGSTLSVLIKEGKLLAAHSFSNGWESLLNGLNQDKNENLPSKEIFSSELNLFDTENFPQLKKALDELLQMILWNYLSLMKETKIKESPELFVLGEGSIIPGLSSLIETTLGLNKGVLSNFNCTKEELHRFAIPIGLALLAQPKSNLAPALCVNFRQEEFIYSTPWKRFKKPLLIYATLCLGLAASLYFFGFSYIRLKEDNLRFQFLNLLSFTQKPYEAFETLYEQKYPLSKKGEGTASISELNSQDLSDRVDFLENSLKSMPETFPLLPNIPRVSDVLVWLSTHPNLICKEHSAPLDCLPFTIDVFNYSLVKRPEIAKKKEKYQVKIDLEFSTSSPRQAREFHDALITPNDFVDPKGEIKWTATKGKYRTSFYLKDKTAYP